jgi:hypothetical protein
MVRALIPRRMRVNRIIKPLVVVLAAIWFLVDAIFATIAHPLARWLGEHWVLCRLRTWIRSLRPYPALALFAVPLIILEPVKPVAAYLAATGKMELGLIVLVVGEILKLVLVERLFSLNRDKLLSIPAWSWTGWSRWRLGRWCGAGAGSRGFRSAARLRNSKPHPACR